VRGLLLEQQGRRNGRWGDWWCLAAAAVGWVPVAGRWHQYHLGTLLDLVLPPPEPRPPLPAPALPAPAEADRDGDGEVNEDEFFRIMKKTSLFG
jgi:hypothetical protein